MRALRPATGKHEDELGLALGDGAAKDVASVPELEPRGGGGGVSGHYRAPLGMVGPAALQRESYIGYPLLRVGLQVRSQLPDSRLKRRAGSRR